MPKEIDSSYLVLSAWARTINTHLSKYELDKVCLAFPSINSKVCILLRDVNPLNELARCRIQELLFFAPSSWEKVDVDKDGNDILLSMFDPLKIEDRVNNAIETSLKNNGLRAEVEQPRDPCILCGVSTSLFYKSSSQGLSLVHGLERYEGVNEEGKEWIVRSYGERIFDDKNLSEAEAVYRYTGNNFGPIWQQWKI